MTDHFFESNLFVFFRFKSYLFKRLAKPILYISILTTIVCILYHFEVLEANHKSFALPGLLGAALGILLVFRNNTAYDRWWEARKVLGAMVNNSRNFALQVNHFVPNLQDKKELMGLIAAFPYALKEHLRSGVLLSEIGFIGAKNIAVLKACDHKPNAIANLMSAKIDTLTKDGVLTDFQRIKLIEYVDTSIDILGKCERIRKTPIPAAHNYLLKFYIFIYTIALPFGFFSALRWWSIFAVAAIYFLAMSIVTIAEEIEEPFGTDPNDLPVDAIAQTIHQNIYEIQNTAVSKLANGDSPTKKYIAEN